MNKPTLIDSADNVLKWLDTISDDELFAELSKCGSVIHYAIHHDAFFHEDFFEFAYSYSSDKFIPNSDYLEKISYKYTELCNRPPENDELYLLAA